MYDQTSNTHPPVLHHPLSRVVEFPAPTVNRHKGPLNRYLRRPVSVPQPSETLGEPRNPRKEERPMSTPVIGEHNHSGLGPVSPCATRTPCPDSCPHFPLSGPTRPDSCPHSPRSGPTRPDSYPHSPHSAPVPTPHSLVLDGPTPLRVRPHGLEWGPFVRNIHGYHMYVRTFISCLYLLDFSRVPPGPKTEEKGQT